jgi:hypothetical protein
VRVLLVCFMVGVIIIVSGSRPSPAQAMLWMFESVSGALVGLATARWLVPPSWYRGLLWRPALMIAAVVTLPMTVVVVVGNMVIARHNPNLTMMREIVPQVFLVSLAMTALSFLVRRGPTETHASAPNAPPPKFLQRLTPRLKGADVWAVEAEDHYLRLHTSLGQDLILMRLSDAVRELEGIEGAQTHRSWWVAREAVTEVERGEGRATLTLKGGTMAPVSRAYVKTLRATGWF